MIEKILFLILPAFFLATFIARNKLVKSKTKQRIRSKEEAHLLKIHGKTYREYKKAAGR